MNTSPDWKSVVLLFAHIFTSLIELYLSVVLLRTLGGSGYSVPQRRLLILGKREIRVKQQIINLEPVHFRYFNVLLFKKKKKKVFKNDKNTSKYMYVRTLKWNFILFYFFLVLLCTRKSVLKICVLGESAHQLHPVPCYTARGFLPPSDLAKEPPLEK